MAYTYTPTYYSSLHDSITSICKNILPFPFKKRRLPAIAAAEQQRAKQQSDNLKWQQESYHQILKLVGLCKEGIIQENEVTAFRAHLLETLIASPMDYEPPVILRDKLIFLQDLFYGKCISEDEYHESKRPLLHRLAVQGAETGERDVIVRAPKISNDEELSVIDLKEEKCLVNSESLVPKLKERSTSKKIKGASSVFAFVTPDKYGKLKEDKDASDPGSKNTRPRDRTASKVSLSRNELVSSNENPFWIGRLDENENESKSILMMESLPEAPGVTEKQCGSEKGKKKQKTWGFKKWKKNNSEDETAPLALSERSDDASYTGGIVGKEKKIQKKLHPNGSPSDFFVDEAFGENVKKELCRIQTELSARSPHVQLSDDQIEEISNRKPVDNDELKKFFPKSWCDQNGDAVLDVIRKEFKDHTGDRENSRGIAEDKHNSKRWTTFDDEENSHPNLFAPHDDHSYSMKQARLSSSKTTRTSLTSSIDKGFKYNPFFDM